MQAALILLLFLTPPHVSDQPIIHMGEHLAPVQGELTYLYRQPMILVDPLDWVRLKDAIEGGPSLCKEAVEATATTAAEHAAQVVELQKGHALDLDLINSYKLKLKTTEDQLATTEGEVMTWRYAAYGGAGLAVVLSSIVIYQAYGQ